MKRSAAAYAAGSMHGFPSALTRLAGEAARQVAGREMAAARWLDAEGTTVRRGLEWALAHDADVTPRLAAALAWWWQLRGRPASQVPLLRQAVDRAAAGSHAWRLGHSWPGQASLDAGDPAGALPHFAMVCDAIGDRGPFPSLAGAAAERVCAARLAAARDAGACGAWGTCWRNDGPGPELVAFPGARGVLGAVTSGVA